MHAASGSEPAEALELQWRAAVPAGCAGSADVWLGLLPDKQQVPLGAASVGLSGGQVPAGSTVTVRVTEAVHGWESHKPAAVPSEYSFSVSQHHPSTAG